MTDNTPISIPITTMPAADVMLKRAGEPGYASCLDCLTVNKSDGETRLILGFTHEHGYTSTTVRIDDMQVAQLIRHLTTALHTPNVATPPAAAAVPLQLDAHSVRRAYAPLPVREGSEI